MCRTISVERRRHPSGIVPRTLLLPPDRSLRPARRQPAVLPLRGRRMRRRHRGLAARQGFLQESGWREPVQKPTDRPGWMCRVTLVGRSSQAGGLAGEVQIPPAGCDGHHLGDGTRCGSSSLVLALEGVTIAAPDPERSVPDLRSPDRGRPNHVHGEHVLRADDGPKDAAGARRRLCGSWPLAVQ